MGEIEGVGEAATGGTISRSIEPEPHEGASRGECLNCGAALIGSYCHRCGQQEHVHRTLGAFWHDLLHGVLHLDGKIWRTLPLLVFAFVAVQLFFLLLLALGALG